MNGFVANVGEELLLLEQGKQKLCFLQSALLNPLTQRRHWRGSEACYESCHSIFHGRYPNVSIKTHRRQSLIAFNELPNGLSELHSSRRIGRIVKYRPGLIVPDELPQYPLHSTKCLFVVPPTV